MKILIPNSNVKVVPSYLATDGSSFTTPEAAATHEAALEAARADKLITEAPGSLMRLGVSPEDAEKLAAVLGKTLKAFGGVSVLASLFNNHCPVMTNAAPEVPAVAAPVKKARGPKKQPGVPANHPELPLAAQAAVGTPQEAPPDAQPAKRRRGRPAKNAAPAPVVAPEVPAAPAAKKATTKKAAGKAGKSAKKADGAGAPPAPAQAAVTVITRAGTPAHQAPPEPGATAPVLNLVPPPPPPSGLVPPPPPPQAAAAPAFKPGS